MTLMDGGWIYAGAGLLIACAGFLTYSYRREPWCKYCQRRHRRGQ